jgi:hypothetical protein
LEELNKGRLMFLKGKILKVRLGYNANSSSIATIVKIFIWSASIASITINMISAALMAKADSNKNK